MAAIFRRKNSFYTCFKLMCWFAECFVCVCVFLGWQVKGKRAPFVFEGLHKFSEIGQCHQSMNRWMQTWEVLQSAELFLFYKATHPYMVAENPT